MAKRRHEVSPTVTDAQDLRVFVPGENAVQQPCKLVSDHPDYIALASAA